jgi:hypothetical protein
MWDGDTGGGGDCWLFILVLLFFIKQPVQDNSNNCEYSRGIEDMNCRFHNLLFKERTGERPLLLSFRGRLLY